MSDLEGIREKIAELLDGVYKTAYGDKYESIAVKASILIKTDQILSLTVSSGGGVCDRCNGRKILTYDGAIGDIDCPTCNGTGQLPVKTLREIIEEWKNQR